MRVRSGAPTMREVAATANVSIGTVSRVLNRHQDVDRELKERVESVVRQLGYKLNGRTRAVVHAKTRMIALILCNDFGISSSLSLVLLGIEEHCAKSGYNLLFTRYRTPANGSAKNLPLPGIIETPGLADCVILAGSLDEELLGAFDHHRLSYVLLANHLHSKLEREPGCCQVRYDDEGGCHEATRYLAQLGHRSIWYVGDESRPWHHNRHLGYLRAMSELDLPPHVHAIALSDDEFENGQAAVSYILDQQWPATAILAASDEIAFGVREGLRQHRREVPKDVSLIGMEYQIGRSRGSNLTSVCIDLVEVGRQLARVAIAKIEDPSRELREAIVPAAFMKRSTCRPLRKPENMLL